MKFCFKLDNTATETHEMLVGVCGDAAVSRKWFERFCGGAESTEGEQRSGRPSTWTTDEHVSKINEMIRANRKLTIREISNSLQHFIWLNATRIDETFEHETSECGICFTHVATRTEKNSACRYHWNCMIMQIHIQVC
jgi:hypothetical protein